MRKDVKKIYEAISNYAQAYRDIQNLQDLHEGVLLPKEDQKTGVIG